MKGLESATFDRLGESLEVAGDLMIQMPEVAFPDATNIPVSDAEVANCSHGRILP